MLSSIIFLIFFGFAVFWFSRNAAKVKRNINLGKDKEVKDRISERWRTMLMVAIGQQKMLVRPTAAILHIFVYVGFIIINIEVVEIVIDGIFGTHRVLSFLGDFYYFLISSFEVLALLVLVGVVVFFMRRNVVRLKRFTSDDLNGWARSDANYILLIEVLLMSAFLLMNAADGAIMTISHMQGLENHYVEAAHHIFGASINTAQTLEFPVSKYLAGMLPNNVITLQLIERSCWWFHIIGILAFLNYLPYSKHFHIILSFPNVFFSNLDAKGRFSNLESVTNEVKLMLDPSAVPASDAAPTGFGAKDVTDLTWVQLLNAYSCTECGRCTSNCPANQTGKLLSPRKIMMSTRDRLEEVGKNIDTHGADYNDNKSLLGDYITPEELWACTTCNACTESCPINIDPLSIIVDLRRYLVMEQSSAPASLNAMFTNIENNGAPWQFSPTDRLNWKNED
jgi:heterodisulfide reductase subunit C